MIQEKNFDELFFKETPHAMIENYDTREALEMVRLAPSASNKQPWRVMMDANGDAHFFIHRTPNYEGGKIGYDIQWLDMGIAVAHYEIAVGDVEFVSHNPATVNIPDLPEYVISAKKKR